MLATPSGQAAHRHCHRRRRRSRVAPFGLCSMSADDTISQQRAFFVCMPPPRVLAAPMVLADGDAAKLAQ